VRLENQKQQAPREANNFEHQLIQQ
jgi:hypothetical protein